MRRKDITHALRLVVCSSLIDEQLSATCHMTPDDFPALSLCYLSLFCPWCPGWAASSAWCWKRWEETLLHGFTATPFSTSASASLSVMNKGQCVTKYYRWIQKNSGYIWIQSSATIAINAKNAGEKNIIWVNYVLRLVVTFSSSFMYWKCQNKSVTWSENDWTIILFPI